MQKKDVLAHVRPKPLLHSLDVPYARLLCVLLCFRAPEEGCMAANAILRLHGSKEEPEGMSHHKEAQCCLT